MADVLKMRIEADSTLPPGNALMSTGPSSGLGSADCCRHPKAQEFSHRPASPAPTRSWRSVLRQITRRQSA